MEQNDPQSSLLAGLNVWANIGVELGNAVRKQNEINERLWRKLQFSTPVRTWQVASGVYPASGNLMLSLGSPDAGTYWDVRTFAIGGTDVNITAAGKFGLYVSGYATANASPGLGALVDGGEYDVGAQNTMPYNDNYGAGTIRVNDQENIYAIIFGGTPGQTYVANVMAYAFNWAASQGNVIETA
jgi:hypothetical protein